MIPVIPKGVYRHSKTGNRYLVLGIALQTESQENLVIYQPLYSADYEYFARPYTMFTEMVEISGVMKPRFEYLGPQEV